MVIRPSPRTSAHHTSKIKPASQQDKFFCRIPKVNTDQRDADQVRLGHVLLTSAVAASITQAKQKITRQRPLVPQPTRFKLDIYRTHSRLSLDQVDLGRPTISSLGSLMLVKHTSSSSRSFTHQLDPTHLPPSGPLICSSTWFLVFGVASTQLPTHIRGPRVH